jgi:hypothetical protein
MGSWRGWGWGLAWEGRYDVGDGPTDRGMPRWVDGCPDYGPIMVLSCVRGLVLVGCSNVFTPSKSIQNTWKVIIMGSTSAELATTVVSGRLDGCRHSLVQRHQQAW